MFLENNMLIKLTINLFNNFFCTTELSWKNIWMIYFLIIVVIIITTLRSSSFTIQ